MSGGPDAARVLELCRVRGWTLGVAESLTGGGLTSAFVDIPGASLVLRGGVVAYATDLKARLLGVDGELLGRLGPVAGPTALAMAAGVRRATGSDVGLATTGVAGPDPQDGHEPGLVFVAFVAPGATVVRELHLHGDRAAVRADATAAALTLALDVLRGPQHGVGEPEISPLA